MRLYTDANELATKEGPDALGGEIDRGGVSDSYISDSTDPADRQPEMAKPTDCAADDERNGEINRQPSAEEIENTRDIIVKILSQPNITDKYGSELAIRASKAEDSIIATVIRSIRNELPEWEAEVRSRMAPQLRDPRLLTLVWDGERDLVFPTCLVDDLITVGSIGMLAGESQAGKTFLAIDLAFALALGQQLRFAHPPDEESALRTSADHHHTNSLARRVAHRLRVGGNGFRGAQEVVKLGADARDLRPCTKRRRVFAG